MEHHKHDGKETCSFDQLCFVSTFLSSNKTIASSKKQLLIENVKNFSRFHIPLIDKFKTVEFSNVEFNTIWLLNLLHSKSKIQNLVFTDCKAISDLYPNPVKTISSQLRRIVFRTEGNGVMEFFSNKTIVNLKDFISQTRITELNSIHTRNIPRFGTNYLTLSSFNKMRGLSTLKKDDKLQYLSLNSIATIGFDLPSQTLCLEKLEFWLDADVIRKHLHEVKHLIIRKIPQISSEIVNNKVPKTLMSQLVHFAKFETVTIPETFFLLDSSSLEEMVSSKLKQITIMMLPCHALFANILKSRIEQVFPYSSIRFKK